MNPGEQKRSRSALWYGAAGLLALNLAACGDKSPEPAKPAPPINPAPALPEKPVEPPKESPSTNAAPAGKTAEDTALAAKVKTALITEPGLDAQAIDVQAKGGVVSLFGTMDNDANRDKAERVTSKVEGVKSVVNKLVIARGS